MKYTLHLKIAFLIITVVLTVYSQVIWFDFVDGDDAVNIYENPCLSSPSLENILRFWTTPYEGLYIPLTYSAWAMEAWIPRNIWGGAKFQPPVFHGINLLLHIFNGLLAFLILKLALRNYLGDLSKGRGSRALIKPEWAACMGALLFVLHPMQTEPVAWVTGMKDLLFAFFSLLALWGYLVHASNIHWKANVSWRKTYSSYSLASLAFLLALLSKPTAVVVPVMAGILDFAVLRRPPLKSVLLLLPWALISLPAILITRAVQQPAAWEFTVPLELRPLIAWDAVAFYLQKLAFPFQLAAYAYSRSPENILRGEIYNFTWFFPVALVLIAWRQRENARWWLAGAGIFIVGIVPVLGLVPFIAQKFSTVSDRYLYLSMLGPSLGLAFFLSRCDSIAVALVCVLMLGIFGVRSLHQAQYWRNSMTLFEHALDLNHDSYIAHYNIGVALSRQGKQEKAITHYSEALRIRPRYAQAHYNLGHNLAEQGRTEEAVAHYRWALEVRPDLADAHVNLGIILSGQGRFPEAIDHYSEALRLEPNSADIHNNLGNILVKLEKYNDAITHYSQALRIDPDNASVHNNIGNVLAKKGDQKKAVLHFREALRINPNAAGSHFNLGLALSRQGSPEEASAHFTKAIDLKPDFSDAYYHLALVLAKAERYDASIAHFSEAVKLNPSFAEGHFNLGVALAKLGKVQEADAAFAEAIRINPELARAHEGFKKTFGKEKEK